MRGMTRFVRLSILAALVECALMLGAAQAASAQSGPTRVQQDPSVLTACSVSNATAAINNQVTVTITPPSGQYVYICGIDVASSQNATSTVNTNLQYTSTNLGGWSWKYSLAATVNIAITQAFYFNNPVKSAAAGTAVTVVSPGATANTAFNINVYYYFAP